MTSPETRTSDPVECYEAREGGDPATCGQPDGSHCEDCALCPGEHADTCVHTPVERLDQLELIGCDAEPRHHETWTRRDPEAWYPPGCPYCWHDNARDQHAGCEHSHHWPWRRWQISHRVLGWAYSLGLVAGWGVSYDAPHCYGCISGRILWRSSRGWPPYVLGWPSWKWGCLLKNRHWPGPFIGLGCCTKCAPCPECGSTAPNHDVFHQASSLGLNTTQETK